MTQLSKPSHLQQPEAESIHIMCEDAAQRPVVKRGATLIMVDDDRMLLDEGETPEQKMVRFGALGRYPLTEATESKAATLEELIAEILATTTSERVGRVMDRDQLESMENKKQEGYF